MRLIFLLIYIPFSLIDLKQSLLLFLLFLLLIITTKNSEFELETLIKGQIYIVTDFIYDYLRKDLREFNKIWNDWLKIEWRYIPVVGFSY